MCGMRLADFAKTELFRISLTKLGASASLSKLQAVGSPFTLEKALTQRLQAYLTQGFEIREEELLKNPRKNCCYPRELNEVKFLKTFTN